MPAAHHPPHHTPVMAAELVGLLDPTRGGRFVDCTVGTGGHAQALLAAGADRVLGIDRDAEVLPLAGATLAAWDERVELVHADYRQIDVVLDQRQIASVDGVLADLGVSSVQLGAAGRGFSFNRDEPLDMRMDRSAGATAAELLREASEQTLADRIFEYGEERYARRIARAIVEARTHGPFVSTAQLAALVRRAAPRRRGQRIDAATRTFQALRIWVNDELEGLGRFLHSACARLRAGARLAVITFHSLEDRIVKWGLRELERAGTVAIRVVTKRPLRPGPEEIRRNPRARSAKLRAAERLP